MFDGSIIWRAQWGELFTYFTAGDPPLLFRLLVINTIFLVLFIVRSAKAKSRMRRNTAYVIQLLLILANFAVIFQAEIASLALHTRHFT